MTQQIEIHVLSKTGERVSLASKDVIIPEGEDEKIFIEAEIAKMLKQLIMVTVTKSSEQ